MLFLFARKLWFLFINKIKCVRKKFTYARKYLKPRKDHHINIFVIWNILEKIASNIFLIVFYFINIFNATYHICVDFSILCLQYDCFNRIPWMTWYHFNLKGFQKRSTFAKSTLWYEKYNYPADLVFLFITFQNSTWY